jgi:hypothetical protein
MVPATVYGAVNVKAESKVRFTDVAKRAIQTWSPQKQHALIRTLSKPEIKAVRLPAAGYQVLRMPDGGRVVFSRKQGKVVVENVFDRGFGPEL